MVEISSTLAYAWAALVGGGVAAFVFSAWLTARKMALERLLEKGGFQDRGAERSFTSKYILGFYSGGFGRKARSILTGTTAVWFLPVWLGIAYTLAAYFVFVYFGSELYVTLIIVLEALAFVRPLDVIEFAYFSIAAAKAEPGVVKTEDVPYLRKAVSRISRGRVFYIALGAGLILVASADYFLLGTGSSLIAGILPKGFSTADFHLSFVVALSAVLLLLSRIWHPIELVYD